MAGTVFNVSTSAELKTAMAKATGGDTILLATGNYGSLNLAQNSGFDITYDSQITIRSADPANPATFTGMDIQNAANIKIDSVVFDYTFKSTDALSLRPFVVSNSSGITISNSVFDGDVASGRSAQDNGFGTGVGFAARGCTNLTFTGNEMTSFLNAANINGCKGVTITNNDIHSMRQDGLKFSQVSNVLIQDNQIHNFNGSITSGDHRDFIQFFTAGTTQPSANITIRGNTLDIGDGTFTQSIFMRNDLVDKGLAGASMYYQNVLIENNAIYNDQAHGIEIGATNGLTIRNNSVLHADGNLGAGNNTGAVSIPGIGVYGASTSVIIQDNVTGGLSGLQSKPGWVVSNNLIVQDVDPNAPNHYTDLFLTSTLSAEKGHHNFIALPSSVIETQGVGSTLQLMDDAPSHATPLFQVGTMPNSSSTLVFDAASYTAGPAGLFAPGEVVYQWDFGDGTKVLGGLVSHQYAVAGQYNVTLRVIERNGTVTVAGETIISPSTDVLTFDSASGSFVADSGTSLKSLSIASSALASAGAASAINLGGTGTAIKVNKSNVADLFGSDNFTLHMKLQADKGALSWGEVFELPKTFDATVDKFGALVFTVWTADGKSSIVKSPSNISLIDGKLHDVKIDFDSAIGKMTISVDGHAGSTANVASDLRTIGYWDLAFGNPWGGKNFEGQLRTFEIDVDRGGASYPTYTGKATPISSALAPVDPGLPGGVGLVTADYALDSDSIGLVAGIIPPGVDPVTIQKTVVLAGDALVESIGGQNVLSFDGDQDQAWLGRLTQFEQSDRIAFSVDFQRDQADGSLGRLVWNPEKIGLAVVEDGFRLRVATADEGFKVFDVANVGLNDTEWHRAEVIIDAATDRLQVYIDNALLLDESATDIAVVDASTPNYAWTLSDLANGFDGHIAEFRLSDDVAIFDAAFAPDPTVPLV